MAAKALALIPWTLESIQAYFNRQLNNKIVCHALTGEYDETLAVNDMIVFVKFVGDGSNFSNTNRIIIHSRITYINISNAMNDSGIKLILTRLESARGTTFMQACKNNIVGKYIQPSQDVKLLSITPNKHDKHDDTIIVKFINSLGRMFMISIRVIGDGEHKMFIEITDSGHGGYGGYGGYLKNMHDIVQINNSLDIEPIDIILQKRIHVIIETTACDINSITKFKSMISYRSARMVTFLAAQLSICSVSHSRHEFTFADYDGKSYKLVYGFSATPTIRIEITDTRALLNKHHTCQNYDNVYEFLVEYLPKKYVKAQMHGSRTKSAYASYE